MGKGHGYCRERGAGKDRACTKRKRDVVHKRVHINFFQSGKTNLSWKRKARGKKPARRPLHAREKGETLGGGDWENIPRKVLVKHQHGGIGRGGEKGQQEGRRKCLSFHTQRTKKGKTDKTSVGRFDRRDLWGTQVGKNIGAGEESPENPVPQANIKIREKTVGAKGYSGKGRDLQGCWVGKWQWNSVWARGGTGATKKNGP